MTTTPWNPVYLCPHCGRAPMMVASSYAEGDWRPVKLAYADRLAATPHRCIGGHCWTPP